MNPVYGGDSKCDDISKEYTQVGIRKPKHKSLIKSAVNFEEMNTRLVI